MLTSLRSGALDGSGRHRCCRCHCQGTEQHQVGSAQPKSRAVTFALPCSHPVLSNPWQQSWVGLIKVGTGKDSVVTAETAGRWMICLPVAVYEVTKGIVLLSHEVCNGLRNVKIELAMGVLFVCCGVGWG